MTLLHAALLPIALSVSLGCAARRAELAPRPRKSLVEILSWWMAPGEAEALQALTSAHTARFPETRIFNSAATSAAVTRNVVADRLRNGDPPDLLQLNARELRGVHEQHPNALEPLDDLFEQTGLKQAIFPEALNAVSIAGHVMAMPVNLHRENAFFYNKAIFAAHRLAPPRSIPELLAACKTLRAAGVTPIALAHEGWILRMVFNAIAAGTMGSAAYHDYFTGKDSGGLPRLRQAIAIFGEILALYANPDAGEEGFGWTNAAQTLYNGDAAMLFHGDWAKGYLVQLGWRPGIDFGVIGSPGAADLFLYLTDSFAMSRGARNERGARELLATVASPAGQVAFNRLKGSSPIRGDVRMEALDSLGQATLTDLARARIRMPAPNMPVMDDALARFAADRDAEALLRAYVVNRE